MSVAQLHFLFGKMLVSSSAFFNWVVFLMLSCMSFLYILEINPLSFTSFIRQTSYHITYICNLKNGGNELICRTETDSQTLKTNLELPKGTGGRVDWEFGIGICTLR